MFANDILNWIFFLARIIDCFTKNLKFLLGWIDIKYVDLEKFSIFHTQFNVEENLSFTYLERSFPCLPKYCVGEKTLLFALPFPIFDLVHMQVILSNFDIDEQLFTQTAFTR